MPLSLSSQQNNKELIIQHKLIELLNLSDVCVFYCEFKENWPTLYISENISHYGYCAADFISGMINYLSVVEPLDINLLQSRVALAIESQESKVEIKVRMISDKGITHWVEVRLVLEKNIQGEVAFLLGTLWDVTDKVMVLEKQIMFSKVLEQTSDIVKVTDAEGRLIFVNKAFSHITEYSSEEVLGKTPAFLKSELTDKKKAKSLWQDILNGQTYHNVIKNRKKSGEYYFEEITITPVYDTEGKVEYFVSTGKDATRRIALQNKLKEMAMTDALTGVCNRRRIDEIIEQEIERVDRYGSSFTLILLDIDFFKIINDDLGHLIGDKVLVAISNLIKSQLRKNGHVGRWGGEEFLIVAQGVGLEEGVVLAEKFRMAIEQYDFGVGKTITASFGVACYQAGELGNPLFKRLDDALYLAKENGRNRVELAT